MLHRLFQLPFLARARFLRGVASVQGVVDTEGLIGGGSSSGSIVLRHWEARGKHEFVLFKYKSLLIKLTCEHVTSRVHSSRTVW